VKRPARIAVLEDDPSLAKLIARWLERQGFAYRLFSSGAEMLRELFHETYDLAVLDWDVPDLSGEEVLKAIRKSAREPVPVLFATGHDREEDIVHVLREGADDYLTKPLRRFEFLARVEALLRRSRGGAPGGAAVLEAGAFRLDPPERSLRKHDVPVRLTQKEFDLALLLFRNVGRLLTRAYLLDTVWGGGAKVSPRTVDTHASQLRTKLGLRAQDGWRLRAVYQYGYRLEQLPPPRRR
jgi:DNA-binding response OmpR family regulator